MQKRKIVKWVIFTITLLIHLNLISSFDLLSSGGLAVALRFERAPFIMQEHTLWLPWSRFFVMDTVVMRHEVNDIPSCDLSSFTRPSPIVLPAPLTAFATACQDRGIVVPEIQVRSIREHRKHSMSRIETVFCYGCVLLL